MRVPDEVVAAATDRAVIAKPATSAAAVAAATKDSHCARLHSGAGIDGCRQCSGARRQRCAPPCGWTPRARRGSWRSSRSFSAPFQRTGLTGFWTRNIRLLMWGPFVNRNHFAGWMVMAISVGLGYFMALVQPRDARHRRMAESRALAVLVRSERHPAHGAGTRAHGSFARAHRVAFGHGVASSHRCLSSVWRR